MSAARIILTTTGSLGDLHPFIGLGQGLAARGHHVAIATTGRYRAEVEAAGIGFHPMRPDLPSDPDFHRQFMDTKNGARFVYREFLSPAIAESYQDLSAAVADADLLVSQSLALAAPIVAHVTGIKWASAVFQPMTLFSAYDPPAVPPMPLIHAPKWEWQIALNQKVLEAGLKHTAGWTAPVRDFAAAHGLPNYGNPIFGAQHSPHCVLAMFSALIGRPQPDWPAHTHQTGSVLYAASTGHLPPALTAFLAAGPQPILFTLGTSSAGAAGDFFQLCLEAANRLGRRALLLTGSAPLPGNLPDWALALPFVPYQAVFPQAAAIVHSGGIGSLMMGLQAGKPQLAITYAHDQHDNALRGARLGAVVTLKRNDLSANRLTRALRQLLEKDRYRQAAQQAQRQLAQEYPVKAACDCLEALLAQSGG